MANADAPFGFKPVNRDGSAYSGGTFRCVLLTGNGTATFIGDAVKLGSTSLNGAPEVVQGTANAAVFGVITSFEANPSDLEAQYRKADTQRFCQVAPSDSGFFMVQDNGTLGAASAGLNADMLATTGGSTVTGLSAMEADSGTELTTATLDLQLWAPVNREDNDSEAANADWIVKFNKSQTANARTGVA